MFDSSIVHAVGLIRELGKTAGGAEGCAEFPRFLRSELLVGSDDSQIGVVTCGLLVGEVRSGR